MGLRAPGAGDTEPGAAGPGAGEARGLAEAAASAQSMVGGGGPWESFFAARRVRALRTQTRLGLGGLRSGALGRGGGARAGGGVCVRADPGWTLAPPSGVCGGGGAGGGVWRGGGGGWGSGGGGEPGSGEKLASAWVRADGAGGGERGALGPGGDAGRGAAAGSESPRRCTRPGRAPATPVLGFRSRLSLPSSCYLQKNPAAWLFAGLLHPNPHFPTSVCLLG